MEMIQMYILDSIWKLWSRSDSKSCPNNWIWFWTWNSPSSNNRFEIPKWATQSVNQKKSKFFTWYRHPISRVFKPKTKKNCITAYGFQIYLVDIPNFRIPKPFKNLRFYFYRIYFILFLWFSIFNILEWVKIKRIEEEKVKEPKRRRESVSHRVIT